MDSPYSSGKMCVQIDEAQINPWPKWAKPDGHGRPKFLKCLGLIDLGKNQNSLFVNHERELDLLHFILFTLVTQMFHQISLS